MAGELLSFFSARVDAKNPFVQQVEDEEDNGMVLRITGATLDLASSGKAALMISIENSPAVAACVLSANVPSARLDLLFSPMDEVTFTVKGDAAIHLTGYRQSLDMDSLGDESDEDMIDEDLEDDEEEKEEEDEAEEEAPALIPAPKAPATGNKRKEEVSQVQSAHASKKPKSALPDTPRPAANVSKAPTPQPKAQTPQPKPQSKPQTPNQSPAGAKQAAATPKGNQPKGNQPKGNQTPKGQTPKKV